MKPETEKTVAMLNVANLLAGGGRLNESHYVLVPSFKKALKLAASKSWEHFVADIHNGIFTIPVQRRIRAESGDDSRWNTTCETIAKALGPALRKIRSHEWTRVTRFPFESLLFDACGELEIAHIIPPVFFYPVVLPVLCAGHFPCGWDGDALPEDWTANGPEDMPKGKLMVHLMGREKSE